MGKIVRISSVLIAICIALTGCKGDAPTTNNVSSGSQTSSSESTVSSSQAEPVASLEISKQNIITTLNERLESMGFTSLSDCLHSEMKEEIEGKSYQCDLYGISNGISFYFLSDVDTGKLLQFTFKANEAQLSPDAFLLLSYIQTSLTAVFEPDTWEEVNKQLGLSSSDEKVINNTVSGEQCEYHYIKDGENLDFHAIVPNSSILDVKTLDFTEGTITPQKIDWTLPDFVTALNQKTDGSISALASGTPTPVSEAELKDFGLSGDIVKGEYYQLGSGVRLYLYASESGRLERAEYIVLTNSATNDSITAFATALTHTAHLLDAEQATRILDTIDMGNMSLGERRASGGQMGYFYSISEESILCFISRTSPLVTLKPEAEQKADSTVS